MTDENKNLQDEKDSQTEEQAAALVLSPEDAQNVIDYFKHFKIDLPDQLAAACGVFVENTTLTNQKELKRELCNAIRTSKHESFTDKMFAEIRAICTKAEYDLEFEKELRDVIGQKKD